MAIQVRGPSRTLGHGHWPKRKRGGAVTCPSRPPGAQCVGVSVYACVQSKGGV